MLRRPRFFKLPAIFLLSLLMLIVIIKFLKYETVLLEFYKDKFWIKEDEVIEETNEDSSENEDKTDFYRFVNKTKVKIWIDVPNAFPWRHCLKEYFGHILPVTCEFNDTREIIFQTFRVLTHPDDDTKISLRVGEAGFYYCVQADLETWDVVAVERNVTCLESDHHWRWNYITGALEFNDTGKCLTSTNYAKKVVLRRCDEVKESQMIEFGVDRPGHFDYDGHKISDWNIGPISYRKWKIRMNYHRDRELKESLEKVREVLEEIQEMNRTGELMKISGMRRAIVFYLDHDKNSKLMLTWWIYAWRLLGLDSAEQAFDIILFVNPNTKFHTLGFNCSLIDDDEFDPESEGAGGCYYAELSPLIERDERYDKYLSSQECLFNKVTSRFLVKYRILIRADLDTFPTPALLNYWPETVICNPFAMTTHLKKNIEDAIKKTALAAGITHRGWHNTDSAWMGPSRRIIMLSKLTTYLARFTRAHMFGPGTVCRCSMCTSFPPECEWGTGIYAGTLLLYAQEIAMNHLWSQREKDDMKYPILDGSCTNTAINICTPALLHARHNTDIFSKHNFFRGGYKNFSMKNLDISNVRDWSMYIALHSTGQGTDAEIAWQKFQNKTGGKSFVDYCQSVRSGR